MRKWLRRILLCIILVFVIWAGVLYNCAVGNRKYNVVVEVERQGRFGPRYSVGSGVVISEDGLILTAGHVVEDASKVKVTLSDGQEFITEVFYADPNEDVGLIPLFTDVNDFIHLSDSNDITPYDIVYNIGNANGIWDNSIFFGIVYENHFKRMFLDIDSEFMFAKMKVYPGCSGGGVYHYNKLIGVVVMGVTRDRQATFIVPSNVCAQVIEDYRNATQSHE